MIPKLSTISTWLTLNGQVELLIAVFREAGVGLEEKEVKKIKIFDSYFRFFLLHSIFKGNRMLPKWIFIPYRTYSDGTAAEDARGAWLSAKG